MERFLKAMRRAPSSPGFEDHAWRALDVPHRMGHPRPVDKSLDPQTGRPADRRIGCTRKHFTLADGVTSGRHLEVAL